jgi:catecholate siderophore receptor
MSNKEQDRSAALIAKAALVSVSYAALIAWGTSGAQAQSTQGAQAQGSQLPPVQIDAPTQKPRRQQSPTTNRGSRSAARAPRRNAPRVAAPPTPSAPPTRPVDTQEARTGTVGVYANSTSVATKTNTPLVNIPQSVDVLSKSFIKDQSFQSIDDAVRYVPGVIPHQGEGNRDELVIRGVDSSANFFVNGFRDDVQYFRDLYNTQSIEVLKGPSALIFGRGAGGGLLNRTLKEADWSTIREVTAQTGSWADRRIAVDVGQGINQNVAARLNAFYEQSDTFRDYGHFERYGINPTVSFWLDDATKVKLSYELYHDERLADRGNPSQSNTDKPLTAANAAAVRANPATPFVSDWSTFFGSPVYNGTYANVQQGMAFIEHDFGDGLSVKNGTIYASYLRGYRNIYPGNGSLSGAVNIAGTTMNLAAYENATNRNNLFNQTDFTYKTATGPVRHTLTFGTEFGLQAGFAQRDTGYFPANGNANTIAVNPFAPTYFGPVNFIHTVSAAQTDASSRSDLYIQSGYVQDQIELTRWLQLIAGGRFDRFDFTALDQNTNITRNRVDEKVSPRAALIVKPVDNLSIYGSYAVSYLPASGDQFTTLSAGTLILEPQKFENKEVGVKWNINPHLLFTAAVYELIRTNVPIADPNNLGFFFPSGSHKIQGFETALKGYITDAWQSSFGYAYTDARITSATSTTIVPGNVVQLVPFHQFSWWNKYQFTPMWSAAVGAIYFSDSFASSDNSVKLPGFVRFDAAVYAKINETWKAQINVENVFNKGYWATADGNNNISPGQPRTVRLTATANF